jgi:hypothetical protein
VTARDFAPAFRLASGQGDAGLVPAPWNTTASTGRLLRRSLAKAAKEHGDRDLSATYLVSTPKADAE